MATESFEQVGSADTLAQGQTAPSCEPDQGHAVGHHQIGMVQSIEKSGILLGFAHTVHARDGHVASTPAMWALPSLFLDPSFDMVNRFSHSHRAHADAQDGEGMFYAGRSRIYVDEGVHRSSSELFYWMAARGSRIASS